MLFFKRTKKINGLWAIALYALSFIVSTLLQDYIPTTNHVLKLFYSSLTFIEYSLFSYFLYVNIIAPLFKKIIIFSWFGFILFLVLYQMFSKFQLLDTVTIGVETILILIFSFYFLYESITQNETLFIYDDYRFWIVIGFIIYLSGSFFIYIYTDQIPYEKVQEYWPLTNLFSTIKNLLFLIGIFIFAHQKSERPSKNLIQNKYADF